MEGANAWYQSQIQSVFLGKTSCLLLRHSQGGTSHELRKLAVQCSNFSDGVDLSSSRELLDQGMSEQLLWPLSCCFDVKFCQWDPHEVCGNSKTSFPP
jgi:hypothetical protein